MGMRMIIKMINLLHTVPVAMWDFILYLYFVWMYYSIKLVNSER
jgi:hypothetical protein